MVQSLTTTTTTTTLSAASTEPTPLSISTISLTGEMQRINSPKSINNSLFSINNSHEGNSNGLGAMIQNDGDIFGNLFPSDAANHHHSSLSTSISDLNAANGNIACGMSTSNSSVQSNGSSSINTTPSINSISMIHNNNNNSNNNGNSNNNNVISIDNVSGSTITTSIYSDQANRGMNTNANANGMYYSNAGNAHGHVTGHSSGNTNGHSNGRATEYGNGTHNSNKDDENIINGIVPPTTSIPVKYKICTSSQSNAFTITLLVPIPTKTNDGSGGNTSANASPFQKVQAPEDAPTPMFRDNGEQVAQVYALRIPLPYLVQQNGNAGSSGTDLSSSSTLPLLQTEAPWLDRVALRNRINDGGRAIGINPSIAFQSAAAVEETASKLPQWLSPLQSTIEAVSVEVVLSEGIVTLVASATKTNTGTSSSNGPKRSVSPTTKSGLDAVLGGSYVNRNMNGITSQRSNSAPPHSPLNLSSGSPIIQGLGLGSASSSPRQNLNVLHEKSVELLATAPPFPPPGISTSHPNPDHNNGNGNGSTKARQGDSTNENLNGSVNTNGNVHVNSSNNRNGNTASFPAFRTSTENAMSEELYFNNVDHSNNVNSNNNSNHMNSSSNQGNNMCNNNGSIFNSQLLGSSLGSWASYSGQHQQQTQRPTGQSSSFQGPSSMMSARNSFGMTSGTGVSPNMSNNIIQRGMHNGNDMNNNMHLSSSFPSYNYGDVMMREQQNNNDHRSILFDNGPNNINSNTININHNKMNINRPNPSIIIGPLLNMGFSQQECEAAAVAIHRYQCHQHNNNGSSLKNMLVNNQHQHNNYHDNDNNYRRGLVDDGSVNNSNRNLNQNQQDCDNVMVNTMNNMSLRRNSNHANTNNHRHHNSNGSSNGSSMNQRHQSNHANIEESFSSGSVWGNAGKMKMIKNPTNNADGSVDTDDTTVDSGDKGTMNHSTSIQMGGPGNQHQQDGEMVRVLDIPPDLNAFVFHCNSQTRDECLERGMFGCPSGGQYGPHSKAKKGDLLFLADFSAWTVTGIFTAKSDAGLNLEKSAWGGRFPWQIKVNGWTELRTVHIDKINEIIGLASGSKLNMLTKDQLMQLVTSADFGPCVPDHLFKMKRKGSI